jgi:hypothetical protein
MKPLLIFLIFLQSVFLYAQTKYTTNYCDCNKGYILNVNGENKCIDTTDIYYFPYHYKRVDDYPSWNYTILMKIFDESKWNNQSDSENKMRLLFFDNVSFDTLFLVSFSNLDKDTIRLVKYRMLSYFPPLKRPPCGKFSKKDYPSYSTMQGGDTVYVFDYFDSVVYMTDKIRMDNIIQDWYTENYGKIDTVTYTTTEYQIPKKSYDKFFKHVVNLKKYNFDTEMLIDIVLIEYVINNEYQLNWITKDELMLYRDKFFLKNMTNLLKWLNQFM